MPLTFFKQAQDLRTTLDIPLYPKAIFVITSNVEGSHCNIIASYTLIMTGDILVGYMLHQSAELFLKSSVATQKHRLKQIAISFLFSCFQISSY